MESSQTKMVSLIETIMNTFIGFVIGFAAWPVISMLTGISYTTPQHWLIVALFTILSITRGYIIRRFFNGGLHLVAVKVVNKYINLRQLITK